MALAAAQAASAAAASVEVLEGVSVVDSAAEDLEIVVAAVSVADSEIVAAVSAIAAADLATAVVGSVIAVIAVIAAATVAATGLSAARTASLPRMRQTALAEVVMEVAMAVLAVATTGGAAPDLVVGMAVKAAVAHMTIDPAAEASVAATVVAVTATLDSPAATWSPSGLVEKMVGIATMAAATVEVETTTGLETTTTLGSAASTVATKTPGSCDATNKTNLLDVLWWVSKLLSSYLSAPFLPFRQEGKLDTHLSLPKESARKTYVAGPS